MKTRKFGFMKIAKQSLEIKDKARPKVIRNLSNENKIILAS